MFIATIIVSALLAALLLFSATERAWDLLNRVAAAKQAG